MMKAPIPANEVERLKALQDLDLLDTPAEEAFDKITKIASNICGTKVSLISLIDSDRQWFKSTTGIDAKEAPRDTSFCGHAIMGDELFVIPDATLDERFCDNPFVANAPHVRFYAGVPLKTASGHQVGTLCVIDSESKQLSDLQVSTLKILAEHVMDLLKLRQFNKELSESQQKLQTSHKLLNIALEGASLGTWDWSLVDNSVRFDRRWAEMLGLDVEKIAMHLDTWKLRVHPDDLNSCYTDIQAYMEGKTSRYENIHRMRHANGDWVYILDRGKFSEWDQNGKPVRFTGTHFDVTQQKKQEILNAQISQLREKFITLQSDRRSFFDYVLEQLLRLTESEYGFIGEILQDRQGPYLKTYAITDISWNKESQDFYQANQIKGLEFRNLNSLFGQVISSGQSLIANEAPTHPKACGTPSGHPPLRRFMGIPIVYNEKFIAMLGVANRESEYTDKLKGEIQPYLDVVASMIHNIQTEAELEKQRQFAVHQDRLASIGQLAAGVGHEINNPMAIIVGYHNLLAQQLKNLGLSQPDLWDKMRGIESAGQRVINIVQGLRTLSRTDSSEKTTFDLKEVLDEKIKMLTSLYEQESITINYTPPPSALSIFGNQTQIRQVLMNIIANAKDASEGLPERRIDISTETFADSVKITIADSGRGVAQNVANKIFDPFFTTKAPNKGTGIGLSITQKLIEEHRGKISFESQPGVGTSFFISLPLSDKQELSTPPSHKDGPERKGSSEANSFSDKKKLEKNTSTKSPSPITDKELHTKQAPDSRVLQNKNILLIEDESDLGKILKEVLSQQGAHCLLASTGKMALEAMLSFKPDLVISDIKLPDIDGRQLIKMFNLPVNFPVILMTGGVGHDLDLSKISGASHLDVLKKPFENEELIEKVRQKLADKLVAG